MGTESFTPADQLATLNDWADGTLYSIMLQTSDYEGMKAVGSQYSYISFGLDPTQSNSLTATLYNSDKSPVQTQPFTYMPTNGQVYGSIMIALTKNGSTETVPMFFIISMVFMKDDDDSTNVERYLASITLIDDPQTAGVMGAEDGGG